MPKSQLPVSRAQPAAGTEPRPSYRRPTRAATLATVTHARRRSRPPPGYQLASVGLALRACRCAFSSRRSCVFARARGAALGRVHYASGAAARTTTSRVAPRQQNEADAPNDLAQIPRAGSCARSPRPRATGERLIRARRRNRSAAGSRFRRRSVAGARLRRRRGCNTGGRSRSALPPPRASCSGAGGRLRATFCPALMCRLRARMAARAHEWTRFVNEQTPIGGRRMRASGRANVSEQ